jgi:hypothetical protein
LAKWQTAKIFHGGCYREVRYKERTKIYWQGGAKKRVVRLLVVAPVGYRTSKNGRQYYRQPAYLLTTDLTTPAAVLLQDYFDRWGIEVNHRDEKEILGVGEAQVWNEKSVTKVPTLLVSMYSWLLLTGRLLGFIGTEGGNQKLYIYHLDNARLDRLDGNSPWYWSPDNKWISYFANERVKTRPEGVIWELDVEEALSHF